MSVPTVIRPAVRTLFLGAALTAGVGVSCTGGDGAAGSADAVDGPAEAAAGDADAGVTAPQVEVRRFVGHVDGSRTGLATGDFFDPAVVYGSIDVGEEFTNALSFQMTPMAPPLRRGEPSSGPLVLFSDSLETIVVSPLEHFFEALIWFEDGAVHYGLEGEIDEVPDDFAHEFVFVRGQGIASTIDAWGAILRERWGRERTDRYADPGVSRVGYWTDNGAYYYYRTEEGLTEAETLLAVADDARDRGIPLGYVQLDSWWYFKEPGFPPGGLLDWRPQPSMFPDGLDTFADRLGLPLIVHNRWFAPDSVYRERYPFVDDMEMSFPLDLAVFGELMDSALDWGVVTYEQDWLMPQFWGNRYLREGVGRSTDWMTAIDDAARERELTVQITMPGAAHIMDAAARPSVTSVRTSIDYRAGISKEAFWPEFHAVNMVAWAAGVLPFKDNFHVSEAHGEAEALISVLSAGMVGIGDRIGEADPEIVGRTCMADGLILKPDAPAVPLDAMFLPHARPHTTVARSTREDAGTWTYVAAYHLASEHPDRDFNDELLATLEYDDPLEEIFVYPAEVTDWSVTPGAELGVHGRAVAYDWRSGTVTEVGDRLALPSVEEHYGFAYVVLAPVQDNGLALIGEIGKYVTMADRRWQSVEVAEDAIRFRVAGVPGEVVDVVAWDANTNEMLRVSVAVADTGTAEGEFVRP